MDDEEIIKILKQRLVKLSSVAAEKEHQLNQIIDEKDAEIHRLKTVIRNLDGKKHTDAGLLLKLKEAKAHG